MSTPLTEAGDKILTEPVASCKLRETRLVNDINTDGWSHLTWKQRPQSPICFIRRRIALRQEAKPYSEKCKPPCLLEMFADGGYFLAEPVLQPERAQFIGLIATSKYETLIRESQRVVELFAE